MLSAFDKCLILLSGHQTVGQTKQILLIDFFQYYIFRIKTIAAKPNFKEVHIAPKRVCFQQMPRSFYQQSLRHLCEMRSNDCKLSSVQQSYEICTGMTFNSPSPKCWIKSKNCSRWSSSKTDLKRVCFQRKLLSVKQSH